MATVGITRAISWDTYASVGITRTISWDVVEAVPTPNYTATCNPFKTVSIDFLIEGNTRVTWAISDKFNAPGPITYQLQVGGTANPLADDWADVGASGVDSFAMLDPQRRAFGKQLTVHYRVKATDALNNIYYSQPAVVLGDLSFHDWVKARSILRRERQRAKAAAGVNGFLLKRKRDGVDCPICTNPGTGDTDDSSCQACYGTGFTGGYYAPMPEQYVDLGQQSYEEERMASPDVMSANARVEGRFLGNPLLSSGDVWVDGSSDLRYYIGKISVIARVRNLPIVISAEMWQFAFDNVIYKFPVLGT